MLFSTGCAEIHWRSYVFEPGAVDAQREGRPMFIYLRTWYLPECTAFEDNVLHAPAVIQAAEGFYPILLDADWATEQAKAWGVPGAPSVVVLSPDRKVLGRRSGRMTEADIISLLEAAKPKPGPSSSSAPASSGGAGTASP